MKSVGLFIGTDMLLGAEIRGSEKSLEVVDVFHYTITKGIYDDDLPGILENIRRGVKKASVTISFEPPEMDGVFSHITQVPSLTDKELKSSMDYEFAKLIGKTNLEHYRYDFAKLGSVKTADTENLNIYLGGYRKEHITHLESLCKEAKLNLSSVETPLSTSMFFYNSIVEANGDYIDVLIASKTVTFCLFQRGELRYSKSFNYTHNDLLENVESRMSLADELERVFAPMIRANGSTIKKAYIRSVVSRIPQLDLTLSGRLNVEFDYIPLRDVLEDSGVKHYEGLLDKLEFAYAIPLGAAVRPLKKDLSLTLLSKEFYASKDNFVIRQIAMAGVGVLLLSFLGGHLYFESQRSNHADMVQRNADLQQRISTFSQLQSQLDMYRSQIAMLEAPPEELVEHYPTNLVLGTFLTSLQKVTPESVRLHKMTYGGSGQQVTLGQDLLQPTANGASPAPTPAPTPSPVPQDQGLAPNVTPGVAGAITDMLTPSTLVISGVGSSFEDIGRFFERVKSLDYLQTAEMGQIQQVSFLDQKFLSFEISVVLSTM